MIWFAVKTCLILVAVAGGSVLLIDNVPYLKANILEVVNPRVKEAKLVEKLQGTLVQIEEAATDVARDKLIAESKELLQSITNLNEEHSGIVDGVISTVTEALLGTSASPDSTSSPQATPVTVTVTVTPEGCR